MPAAVSDPVTLTVPRSAVPDVRSLSAAMLDRMHDLLERNTDAPLVGVEREELELLVELAQFGQIVSMGFDAQGLP